MPSLPADLKAMDTITEVAPRAFSQIRLTTFLLVQSRSFVVHGNRLHIYTACFDRVD